MVIMIPVPSLSGGGGGAWRERPSRSGLALSGFLLAAYLSTPLYNSALFVSLPEAFGISMTTGGIIPFAFVTSLLLSVAYIFTAAFTLVGAEIVHWWEWTLYVLSIGLVFFWILPLIAANNALIVDFCREAGNFGPSVWSSAC